MSKLIWIFPKLPSHCFRHNKWWQGLKTIRLIFIFALINLYLAHLSFCIHTVISPIFGGKNHFNSDWDIKSLPLCLCLFLLFFSIVFWCISTFTIRHGTPLFCSILLEIEISNHSRGMRPRASTHWWDADGRIVKFELFDGFAQKIEQLNLSGSIYAGVSTQARNLIKSSLDHL